MPVMTFGMAVQLKPPGVLVYPVGHVTPVIKPFKTVFVVVVFVYPYVGLALIYVDDVAV
jgi:hypothetical protein